MARYLATLLLVISLAVAAVAQGPFGGGPGGGGGGGGGNNDPNSCSGQGQVLPKGDCKDFVSYFNSNDWAYNKPDAQFQQVVNGSPNPNARCCAQAQRFVAAGCTCNQELLAHPDRAGTTAHAIQGLGRALPYKCSSVSNPCPAIPIVN